jgi:hypothetical protein
LRSAASGRCARLDVRGQRVDEQAVGQRRDERLLAVQVRAQRQLQRAEVELRGERFNVIEITPVALTAAPSRSARARPA